MPLYTCAPRLGRLSGALIQHAIHRVRCIPHSLQASSALVSCRVLSHCLYHHSSSFSHGKSFPRHKTRNIRPSFLAEEYELLEVLERAPLAHEPLSEHHVDEDAMILGEQEEDGTETIPLLDPEDVMPRREPSSQLDRHLHRPTDFQIRGSEADGERLRRIPPTPSEALTEALQHAGLFSCLPFRTPPHKLDLTFTNAHSADTDKAALNRAVVSRRLQHGYPVAFAKAPMILAQYIRYCVRSDQDDRPQATPKHELEKVFTPIAIQQLQQRSFTVEDVVSWAWVLTATRSEDAARRLLILSNSTADPNEYKTNKAPIFLFLFLLRRENVSARALRLYLIHAWNVVRNVSNKSWQRDLRTQQVDKSTTPYLTWESRHERPSNHPDLGHNTFAILLIRLIRHARISWPQALPNIVSLMNAHKEHFGYGVRTDARRSARLTFLYNKILHLIALPTTQAPFAHIQYQQRALLYLLQRMGEFRPPLMINREGYRAVISVQLAHGKTANEREWALLKAKSWPPWKEERLGPDEDKGVDLGISRAKSTLMRVSEAGYAMEPWEQAASILSGWDTDNSPTIQTRTIKSRSVFSSDSRSSPARVPGSNMVDNSDLSPGEEQDAFKKIPSDVNRDAPVWAARIEATRTVDEAWACFLSYKKGRQRWHASVCFPMFVRLVMARQNRIVESADESEPLTPGDLVGVWSSSPNPRERPYLREPAPDEHRFIEDARAHEVEFYGQFLAFMIKNAETFGTGLQYIKISLLRPIHKDILLARKPINHARFARELHPILAAYVHLLCRNMHLPGSSRAARIHEGSTKPMDSVAEGPRAPLYFARKLITTHRISYRPVWYVLLSALARRNAVATSYSRATPKHSILGHDMATWRAMIELIHEMGSIGLSVDLKGFHILCVGLEKAMAAAKGVLEQEIRESWSKDDTLLPEQRHRQARQILSNSTNWLKGLFSEIAVASRSPRFNVKEDLEDAYPSSQYGSSQEARTRPPASNAEAIASLREDFRDPTGQPLGDPEETDMTELVTGIDEVLWQPSELLPRLIETPTPAVLHAFMRVLGLGRDHEAIRDLLVWMAYFSPEIESFNGELRNSEKLIWRTVVCARVMLERWWESPVDPERRGQTAEVEGAEKSAETQRCMQEAKEIVEKVGSWGPWPSDEDCEQYTMNGKFF